MGALMTLQAAVQIIVLQNIKKKNADKQTDGKDRSAERNFSFFGIY